MRGYMAYELRHRFAPGDVLMPWFWLPFPELPNEPDLRECECDEEECVCKEREQERRREMFG